MNKFTITLHRMIYPVLKILFVLLRRHKFVYVNRRPELRGNVIYAVNHSCKFDTQYVCEIVGRQCYILAGRQPLELADRVAFHLIGTIWVDRKSKEDKKKSVDKMIGLLNNGANLVIFPEGTWNLSPSKPVLPLYWGIIDIARQTGKPIVPVVLEYTREKVYVSFGKPMRICTNDDKTQKINDLSDTLAAMKWRIWERHSDTGSSNLKEWEQEVEHRLNEYPKLDYEYEQSVVRKVGFTAEELIGEIK